MEGSLVLADHRHNDSAPLQFANEPERNKRPPGEPSVPCAAGAGGVSQCSINSVHEAERMDPLIEGYRRFRAEVWPAERARYEALAHWGQSPEAMVIACSDSRVDPQTIFGAVPGELFVVRNIAAIVPPYTPDASHHGTSAALEFGVRVLKIPRLVVLGHGQCGGVKAMAYGAAPAGPGLPRLLGRVSAPRRWPPRARSRRGGWRGSKRKWCASPSPIS